MWSEMQISNDAFCLNTAAAVTHVVSYKICWIWKKCLNTAAAVTHVVKRLLQILFINKKSLNTAAAVTHVVLFLVLTPMHSRVSIPPQQ